MDTHAAPHRRLVNGLIVEGCDNTEVVTAATECPVEIGESFRRRINDATGCRNDFIRSNVIASKTVLIGEITNASTKSKTTDADVCCLIHVSISLKESSRMSS